jgi:hypothetical protein
MRSVLAMPAAFPSPVGLVQNNGLATWFYESTGKLPLKGQRLPETAIF